MPVATLRRAREGKGTNMDRDEIIAAARDVIARNHTFVLATLGEDGGPRIRWMGDLILEEPLTVYMAAGTSSRKTGQIRANPRAQLMFNTEGHEGVVTLSGTCVIQEDLDTRRRAWEGMPVLERFVSGPDDPDLTILRFDAKRVELLVHRQYGKEPLVAEL